MSGSAGIFSFPFRIYATEPLPELDVALADGRHRVHVYSPLQVRAAGMPLSPDVPFRQWPRFGWNPNLPPQKRLQPPSKASSRPGSAIFFDALRTDLRGPDAEPLLHGYLHCFLAWLRQLSRQPWIGAFEPHTDVDLKYSFRCDARGRAIDTPWAHMKAATFASWTQLVTPEIWIDAATRAAAQDDPEPYWELFLDAALDRAMHKLAPGLLSLVLALEVARDRNFPRFVTTTDKKGVGPVLDEPFDDTDLLAHLTSRLEGVHRDGRNLAVDCPDEWEAVRKLYVARHHIAHGGPAVILEDDGVRPATDEDLKDLADPVYRTLVWIEEL